jgi:hypothetical protein
MKTILGFVALAGLTGTAMADFNGGDLRASAHFDIGVASSYGDRATPGASYSNVDNFLGQALANTGAENQGGNTITRMLMDDIHFDLPYLAGQNFTQIKFSVANLNTAAVSARARVRFYRGDGANGGPGTLIAGFTFNAFSFGSGVTVLTGNIGPGLPQPASGMLWAGITFDNNSGASGATADQLNNFGVGLFNPPVIGFSNATYFHTTGAGSFLASNPGGAIIDGLSDGTPGNFGWEFTVPAPGSLALVGLGGLLAGRRRR